MRVPEYWNGSDWLGLFTLMSTAFAMTIHLEVLKPHMGDETASWPNF